MTIEQAKAIIMERRLRAAEEGLCLIVEGDDNAWFIRDMVVWGIKMMEEAG